MKITQEIIKELIDYNPETGLCFWKERDIKWFNDGVKFKKSTNHKKWNTNYANKQIKSISHGYLQGAINGKNYQLHRLIWLYMTGECPNVIDHIDRNRQNNKWSNLRNVDKATNATNCKKRIDNKS